MSILKKNHKAVISAARAYFELLLLEEPESNPVIIFTNMSFKELEAVLRFIYQGEVVVSEDRLAEFLNVLTVVQINGYDCKKLVVRERNVTTCDNDNACVNFETTSIQEGSCVSAKVEGEVSEELADNKDNVQRYLYWEKIPKHACK